MSDRPAARRSALEPSPAGRPSPAPPAFFAGLLAGLVVAVVILHLPSFALPHVEGDEVVFTFLAERLAADPRAYHLQGTLGGPPARRFIADTWARLYVPAVDDPRHAQLAAFFAAKDEAAVLFDPLGEPGRYAYDPAVYDRPMFLHPPLYPYALAAFRAAFGSPGGPALSLLCQIATIVLVALLGRTLADDRVALLAAALVAFDPVSWLCGARLWIDCMSQAMAAAAVLAAVRACRRDTLPAFALAGVVLGLAAWTKLTTLVVAPAIVVALLGAPRPARRGAIAALAGSAAVLVAAWLGITRVGYGAWLPMNRPTAWIVEQNPYLRLVVGRPWHFYLTGLLLVAPVHVYAIAALRGLGRHPSWRVPAVWAGSGLVLLSALALAGLGGGFQLRYLAPAMPGLCLLTAIGIGSLEWWWAAPAMLLGAITFTAAFWSAANPGLADPAPITLMWYASGLGVSFKSLLPGFW
jgi:4-amino-4-deoxy-L-arabinose transferase-like glycosyltransferase